MLRPTKALRRLGAVTAALTVVGLAPLLGAGVASAAEATAVSVSPTTGYTTTTAPNNTFTFDASLVGGTSANGVFFAIINGPGASSTAPFAGTSCDVATGGTATAGPFTCAVGPIATAGSNTVRIFNDTNNGRANAGVWNSGEPYQDVTLVVASSTVNKVTLTPSSQSTAPGVHAGEVFAAAADPAVGEPTDAAQRGLR